VRDARRDNAPDHVIEAIRAELSAAAGEDAEVWEENAAIVEAFLAASTQWRVAGTFGGLVFLGLDYAGARAGIEAAGIEITPELWAGLRVMEQAACAALNEDNA
jgi:hypothetical protein